MQYPSLILQNQFGEKSKNAIIGGQISCNFIVDSANGNGLGIRSLKGNGVKAVYMHTSATPAALNPNPAAGIIIAQLSIAYAGYDSGAYGFVSPSTGSPTASPSNHALVYIAALGSSSLAQWVASGLNVGVVPAVGAAFISNGVAIVGGGTVISAGISGVNSMEIVGDPNLTSNVASGALVYTQILGPTSSSVTTQIPKAPADGTVISLQFNMLSLHMEP